MKRLVLMLLAALLLAGCAAGPETADGAEPSSGLPQDLIGTWTSADAGALEVVETLCFDADGALTVSCTYQGQDAGTLRGTCAVSGGKLVCNITEGAAPFQIEYSFRVDGRELLLTDADGTAQYLRVS